MNVIKSKIINTKYDVFWEEAASIPQNAVPKPVLIITTGCGPGSPESLQLQKMLDACRLAPEQYNIIRLETGGHASWHRLREKLQPNIVFLIGVLPDQLGISALFKLNEPNNFNDKVWLATVSVSELEQHADVKKQLWLSGMKPVFVDKVYGELR